MRLATLLLSTAWAPLLSGCMMMGGLGQAGHAGWLDEAGHMQSEPASAALQRAEASGEGLTIELRFPAPSRGDTMVIDARLRLESDQFEPVDGDVWLQIQAPNGSIDHVRMQSLDASAAGTYRARYRFPVGGRYLLTAQAWSGTGAEGRTVSVTARAEVHGHAHGGTHDWVTPAAILSGLGMVAWMALMMGGATF